MKISIIAILLLSITFSLFSITIINKDAKTNITIDKLKTNKMIKYHTERTKRGKFKSEDWKGVYLTTILKEAKITNYDVIKFTSKDNYMVRLTKEQITKHKPIIALYKNGKELSDEKIRLVGETLRDMFWIQGVTQITVEKGYEAKFPHTVFIAENIFKNIPMRKELPPFTKVEGYKFSDLVSNTFSQRNQDFILSGNDGISHRLNYDKYLSKAVLVYEDGKYFLKSPQMPAGMWIKNLSFVQADGKGIVFKSQFENPAKLAKLLHLKTTSDKVTIKSSKGAKKVINTIPFTDDEWNNAIKFVW